MNNIHKKQLIAGTMIVVMLLVALLVFQALPSKEEGISAMEGEKIADNVAKNWHNDSVFVYLGSMNSDKDGFAEKWYYVYYSPSTKVVENNTTRYEMAYIYIDSQHSTKIDATFAVDSEIGVPIKNWTLDSTDAAKIAKNNPTIKLYLDKHGNADTGYTLQITEKYPNQAVWYITYVDMGFFDDPHNAEIYIDASTGNILFVEAKI